MNPGYLLIACLEDDHIVIVMFILESRTMKCYSGNRRCSKNPKDRN